MGSASIAELKARLSAFLRKVKAGQEIVVTERGRPIARIVPLRVEDRRELRSRLAAEGALRPGRGRVRGKLRSPPEGQMAGSAILDALLEEREEGR